MSIKWTATWICVAAMSGCPNSKVRDILQDSVAPEVTDTADGVPGGDILVPIVTLQADEPVKSLGVWPARSGPNGMERVCGAGDIDGFIFNFALASTARHDNDPDNSARPGDVLDGVTIDGPGAQDAQLTGGSAVSMRVDCLAPQTNPNGPQPCAGSTNGQADGGNVRYVPATSQRDESRTVLFVVDVSGSVSGFVDRGDNLERPAAEPGLAPLNLTDTASDFNSIRLARIKDTITGLRATDRVGALAFKEGLESDQNAPAGFAVAPGVVVGCDGTNGMAVADAVAACWNDKDAVMSAVDDMARLKYWGRSNLWQALDTAYGIMQVRPGGEAKHIVVVTDGPDTCGNDDQATACTTACSGFTAADLVQRMATDTSSNPIRVHFVQFDATGYPGPDPRQMEIACASGGHYRFVNRRLLPNDQPALFQNGLFRAFDAIRLAMMGHWSMDVSLPALASAQTAPGTLYTLSGAATLSPSSNLVGSFAVTTLSGGAPGVLDDRPPLRKACASKEDCGADAAADDSCTDFCSSARICLGDASGVPRKDGTPCGADGTCCADGATGDPTCLPSGETCAACQ